MSTPKRPDIPTMRSDWMAGALAAERVTIAYIEHLEAVIREAKSRFSHEAPELAVHFLNDAGAPDA